MSQQTISQGNPPIVWSTIDDAFQKINANFTELYLSIGGSGVDLSNIASDLIPDSNLTRDLGSVSRRWKDLYLGGSSLYLGNAIITADGLGAVNLPVGSRVGGSLIKDPTNVSFGQISAPGQSDVLANTETGILNFAGVGIDILTNPSTDTITFSNSGVTGVIADTGISVSSASGSVTISNTGVTSAVAGPGIAISAPNGAVTFTNNGVTSLVTDPGSGISLDSSTGTVNITNSAPNIIQPVHRFIAVSGQVTLDAIGPNSTLTFAKGTGIELSTDSFTNTVTIGLSSRLDITGSVFADDSTIIIDSTENKIFSTGGIFGNTVGNHTGDVTGNVTGDLKGSVMADDSTMLVDATNARIVGDIETSRLRTSETKISLGAGAGNTNQGASSVAVGDLSGYSNQGIGAIAVGSVAGNTGQGFNAVAIGYTAGGLNQGQRGIAIGDQTGSNSQGQYAIAIGNLAGSINQGNNSVAIGSSAGTSGQGSNAIAIGNAAGFLNQPANSIIINATGTAVNGTEAGFYIDPVREVTGPQVLYYDPSGTKEVTWGPIPSGGGGGGGGDFELNVAADDSSVIRINSGETLQFIGGTGITTSSDSEGAVTISSAVVGLSSRTTAAGSTGSIADAATASVTVTGFKGYLLYKIQTSAAAWVRIYTSIAARTADSSRAEGVDPSPGAGVIAEVITTGAETILISPGTIGFNDESPVDTNIQMAVTNKSGGPADITVTLTVVKIED